MYRSCIAGMIYCIFWWNIIQFLRNCMINKESLQLLQQACMRGLGNKVFNHRFYSAAFCHILQKYKTNRFWCLKSDTIYTEIAYFIYHSWLFYRTERKSHIVHKVNVYFYLCGKHLNVGSIYINENTTKNR